MKPVYNRKQCELLDWICEVSFAVNDVTLFLDTHPNDKDALEYFKTCCAMRAEALDEYTKIYGPLLVDDVSMTEADYWNWIEQPWPWEEGGC